MILDVVQMNGMKAVPLLLMSSVKYALRDLVRKVIVVNRMKYLVVMIWIVKNLFVMNMISSVVI